MKVRFREEGHLYESKPARKWISVTTLIERYRPHFDQQAEAKRSSLNQRSKWFGMHPYDIIKLWEQENKRSTDCGTWLHNTMENKAIQTGKKVHRGELLIVKPAKVIQGYKLAIDQRLDRGIYPEHLVYNEKYGIAGQVDLPYITDYVDINDYKTNKEIKRHSYGYQFGNPSMMLGPLSHLEDCNYWHYALQLSIYMKLILLKNPNLKPGKLTLHHVTFKNDGYDKYGFPILKRKGDDYVIDKFKNYSVPYLEKEVSLILKNCGVV